MHDAAGERRLVEQLVEHVLDRRRGIGAHGGSIERTFQIDASLPERGSGS